MIRTGLHLVAMVVLGALVFGAFGALVAWRHDQPVVDGRPAGELLELDAPPASVVAQGLAVAARRAASELDGGHRGEATSAVDAAARLASVGRHAGSGPLGWAFDRVARLLEEARVDVQNGVPGAARRHLEEAARVLDDAAGSGDNRPGRDGRPVRDELDDYEGAGLLNAFGARIGEVEGFTDSGGRVSARLRVGGSSDVLGFVDLGGSEVEVPADRLAYGRHRFAGPVHLVVPTPAADAGEIARQFGS